MNMNDYVPPEATQSDDENYPMIPGAGMPPGDIGAAASDFLKWATDAVEKLAQIEHDLKGELPYWDKDKVVWKEVKGRRMLNDAGVNKIVFLIKGFYSKEVITANIDKDEAHKMTRHTMLMLKDTIALNAEEWGLDVSIYSDLILYLDNEIYLALTRVKEGGINKIIKPTLRRIETYTPGGDKKAGGFLGLFKKK